MSASLAEVLALEAHEAAPLLVGATIRTPSASGRLVELEAYEGANDPASHAWRGPTGRSAIMFGPPGYLYVYLCYGLHWLVNLVVAPEGRPGAVLVRGIELSSGERILGPARAARALGLGGAANGLSFEAAGVSLELWGGRGEPERRPRVGIVRGVELPWRFVLPARERDEVRR